MIIKIDIKEINFKDLSEVKKTKILNLLLNVIEKFFNNKKIVISFEKD